ncbi:MAG: serine/threonine protein kinase [Polyangiaceae bacterium]|nr:serine/threonine protein kinase [Polyangiaceae bacterium]
MNGANPVEGSAGTVGAEPSVGAVDHAALSHVFETQCNFTEAARHALLAGDARRAASLAALGGDNDVCRAAMDALVAQSPREQVLAAAVDLSARGFHIHAGQLFERADSPIDAAVAFLAGGDAVRAAACYERAGRPADGARALEAAIRRSPDREGQHLALGRLLARHGKIEGAVRAFQQIPPPSPDRVSALPDLLRCLQMLNLHEAAREVAAEMRERGIPETEPAPTSAAPRSVSQPPAKASVPPGAAARPVLYGRYEVVREVAATPHARLVEAIDRLTGERVAVKTFSTASEGAGRDAWLRFEREARALILLRHPHVVPLRAYLPESGAMVLAWMGGGSLADVLAAEPMAPARAAEIISAVLAALGEAHRLGILHRDVKPSNILFDEAGSPHLSDFGAAHLGDLSSTATAGAIGTFAYMSPEQRLGRAATLASDLYGAGAVFGEMLTGDPPAPGAWTDADDRNLLPSECHPDVSTAHDAVYRRLVDPNPENRPADAFEARRMLTSVHWPARIAPRNEARPRAPSARPTAKDAARLVLSLSPPPGATGIDGATMARDTWMERDVIVLPLNDAELDRARAFARAGHASLPLVLRADLAAQQIWVAPPLGEPLRKKALSLTRGQLRRLREAVQALHAAGGAHGHINADHVYIVSGDVTLVYPLAPPSPDAARDDVAALQALEHP